VTTEHFHARTAAEIDQCANFLKLAIPAQGWRITYTPWREKRSLSQNSFMHVIYRDISNYLISKGRSEWTPGKVKLMLKNKYLGWTEVEFTDVVTGQVTTREVLKSSSALDVGAANHFITEIIEWAASIGIEIKVPAECEYRDVLNTQNR